MSGKKLKSKRGSLNPLQSTPNLLCSHVTTIHSVSQDAPEHEALLEEISRTGAVVSLECPLKKGSQVRLDCRSCELRGKVTGCKKWAAGYMAEVAFEEEQPWQPTEFKPDGLFNPNYLVCENPGCTPDCVGGSCETGSTKPN